MAFLFNGSHRKKNNDKFFPKRGIYDLPCIILAAGALSRMTQAPRYIKKNKPVKLLRIHDAMKTCIYVSYRLGYIIIIIIFYTHARVITDIFREYDVCFFLFH